MLNGLVFLLIGLQLPFILLDIKGVSTETLAWDALLFSLLVVGLRMVWVFPGAWLSSRLRRLLLRIEDQPISPKSVLLVGWAGMRGVLALAAALSLPNRIANGQPFPHRSMILFLTFAVIFATLVLQGLTMPALIRALGLTGGGAAKREITHARLQMTRAALRAISELRNENEFSLESLDAMDAFYRRQLALIESPSESESQSTKGDAEAVFRLAHQLRLVERDVAIRLRDEDKIHDEVLRTLERELDLLEARFSQED
jgi:CPA1 family monovalent cation:H+ antiporter